MYDIIYIITYLKQIFRNHNVRGQGLFTKVVKIIVHENFAMYGRLHLGGESKDGTLLTESGEIKNRWKEYFSEVIVLGW